MSRIGTGEIGLKIFWDKTISDYPLTNTVEVTVLDSVIVLDATQVRVLIENVKAKDKVGTLFSDIDAQITYSLNPAGVVAFYRATREVDANVLGYELIKQDSKNSIVKSFTQFDAIVVNTDKSSIEEAIKESLQKSLDKKFPNTFIITNVNINSAQLDPNVEKVMQNMALLESEKRLINSKIELQKQQSELLDKEMIDLKNTAVKSGVSVKDLLDYRTQKDRNKVLGELAKNNSNVQVQVKE